MRAERYYLEAEWLNNLMIMMLCYMPAECVRCVLAVDITWTYTLFIPLTVVFSYLTRVYVHKLPVYLLLHAVIPFVIYFLPMGTANKVFAYAIFAVFAVTDMMFWTTEGTRSFVMLHPLFASVFLIVFIFSSIRSFSFLSQTSYVCGICFTAMFFLRRYLLNGWRFFKETQVNNSNLPREMFRYNEGIILPLVILFAAGMFLIQSRTVADMLLSGLLLIRKAVRSFLMFLISLLPLEEGKDPAGPVSPMARFIDLGSVKVVPEWVVIMILALEKVLMVLFASAMVYGLVKAVISFVRMYFSRRGYDISRVDYEDHVDIKERVRRNGGSRYGGRLFPRTESERVRRRYRLAVERMRRGGYGFSASHTPDERLEDVKNSYKKGYTDDFVRLTSEYEAQRYGDK